MKLLRIVEVTASVDILVGAGINHGLVQQFSIHRHGAGIGVAVGGLGIRHRTPHFFGGYLATTDRTTRADLGAHIANDFKATVSASRSETTRILRGIDLEVGLVTAVTIDVGVLARTSVLGVGIHVSPGITLSTGRASGVLAIGDIESRTLGVGLSTTGDLDGARDFTTITTVDGRGFGGTPGLGASFAGSAGERRTNTLDSSAGGNAVVHTTAVGDGGADRLIAVAGSVSGADCESRQGSQGDQSLFHNGFL